LTVRFRVKPCCWSESGQDFTGANWRRIGNWREPVSRYARFRRYDYSRGSQMILRLTELQVVGAHALRLAFNDGTRKTVDVYPLLTGPVFEPLRDPAYFGRVTLDPVTGTALWPIDVDIAP